MNTNEEYKNYLVTVTQSEEFIVELRVPNNIPEDQVKRYIELNSMDTDNWQETGDVDVEVTHYWERDEE